MSDFETLVVYTMQNIQFSSGVAVDYCPCMRSSVSLLSIALSSMPRMKSQHYRSVDIVYSEVIVTLQACHLLLTKFCNLTVSDNSIDNTFKYTNRILRRLWAQFP